MASASSTMLAVLSNLLLLGVLCHGWDFTYGDVDGPANSTSRWSSPGVEIFDTFYEFSCPEAIGIINSMVDKFLATDPNLAGGLQRLHFHDCWVNGCDASILLNSTSSFLSERTGFANFLLRGIPEVDEIKAALEAVCPGVVSCADILSLVARDATYKVGGPWWPVALGRRDGFRSLAEDANRNLPFPTLNFSDLERNFAEKGFTAREMVVLSGAHTIGRSHCNAVAPQLYNFTGIDDLTNPSLDPEFAGQLKQQCPKGTKADNVVDMDPTKNSFDELYFKNLLANKGVFTSDSALITDPLGLQVVTEMSQPGSTFFSEFSEAMVKMGNMDLLTGAYGEVRKHCQYINS